MNNRLPYLLPVGVGSSSTSSCAVPACLCISSERLTVATYCYLFTWGEGGGILPLISGSQHGWSGTLPHGWVEVPGIWFARLVGDPRVSRLQTFRNGATWSSGRSGETQILVPGLAIGSHDTPSFDEKLRMTCLELDHPPRGKHAACNVPAWGMGNFDRDTGLFGGGAFLLSCHPPPGIGVSLPTPTTVACHYYPALLILLHRPSLIQLELLSAAAFIDANQ